MAKKYTIQELKDILVNKRSVTPWEDIKENTIYHIPPIAQLNRRDIMIIKKGENSATYSKIGSKEKEELTMYKTSLFAKFIVKRKKY